MRKRFLAMMGILLLLSLVSVQSQETPDPLITPTLTESTVTTEVTSTPIVETATDLPSQTPSETATEPMLETPVIVETPTEMVVPSPEASASSTPTVQLPLLPLAYQSDFSVGVPSALAASGSWLTVAIADGHNALQAQPPATLTYTAAQFTTFEFQVSALLASGALHLHASSPTNAIRLEISADGAIALFQNETMLVQSIAVLPVDTQGRVRLTLVGDVLTALVDDVAVISVPFIGSESYTLSAGAPAETLVRISDIILFGSPLSLPATATIPPKPTTQITAIANAPAPLLAPTGCPFNGLGIVSVNSDGIPSATGVQDGDIRISDDGRFVAYVSTANNLAVGDTDNESDVFRYDRQTCTTVLISTGVGINNVTSDALQAGSISPDGQFVLFRANADRQLFMRNVNTSMTTQVSVTSGGTAPSGAQLYGGVVSSAAFYEGRVVAFVTADQLTPDDTDGTNDLYVRDVVAGTTTRITSGSANDMLDSYSHAISMTPDARFIAFSTMVSYDANDTDGTYDVYRYNRLTGQFLWITPCPPEDLTCFTGTLTVLGMAASGEEIMIGEQSATVGILARLSVVNRTAATISRVLSALTDLTTPTLALNGDAIVYTSGSPRQAYAFQRSTGNTITLSQQGGTPGNADTVAAVVSGNATRVAFVSLASNLVGNDTVLCGNVNCADVFTAPLSFTYGLTAPMALWVDTVTQTSVVLRWTNTHSVSTHRDIEQSLDGINWRTTVRIVSTRDTYTSTQQSCGVTTYFRVKIYNQPTNSSSPASNILKVTQLPCNNPCTPFVTILEVSRQSPTALMVGNVRQNLDTNNMRVVSADGRYTLFMTDFAIAATDTAIGTGNALWDTYRFDRLTCEVVHVSLNDDETINGGVTTMMIAENAPRFVAFVTTQPLASNDTDALADVYLRDIEAGTTQLISQTAAGVKSDTAVELSIAMSDNGEWILFSSASMALSSLTRPTCNRDVNATCRQTYAKSRISGELIAISTNSTGTSLSDANSLPKAVVNIAGTLYAVYVQKYSNLTFYNYSQDVAYIRPIQTLNSIVRLFESPVNSSFSITDVRYKPNKLMLLFYSGNNYTADEADLYDDVFLLEINVPNPANGVEQYLTSSGIYTRMSALPPSSYTFTFKGATLSADGRYVWLYETSVNKGIYLHDRVEDTLRQIFYSRFLLGMSADGLWVNYLADHTADGAPDERLCENVPPLSYNDSCADSYLQRNPYEISGYSTPSPTYGPSPTRTPGPTNTFVPWTPTITNTPTPTLTKTITPGPSPTASRTGTATATQTPSRTPTPAAFVPNTASLVSPTDVTTLYEGSDAYLRWNSLAHAVGYEVVIATDSAFTSLLSGFPATTSLTYRSVLGLNPGVYYWRVRGVNTQGNAGLWSAVWMFTFSNDVTPTPTASPSPTSTGEPTLTPSSTPTNLPNCPTTSIQLASRPQTGLSPTRNIETVAPLISADGRYVLYVAMDKVYATNPNADTFPDIYRYDRLYCTNRWISNSPDIVRATNGVKPLSMSADGRYSLFSADSISQAGAVIQLFLYDAQTDSTRIISRTQEGIIGAGNTAFGLLSGDAQWAAVVSSSSLRFVGSVISPERIYLIHLATGVVTLLSSEYQQDTVKVLTISHDGRYIGLRSDLRFDVNDTDMTADYFRYDRISGEYALISPCLDICPNPSFELTSMSADGKTFLYMVNDQQPYYNRAYTYSITTRQYSLISLGLTFIAAPYISADGNVIVFNSLETGRFQTYAYKRSTNQLVLLSRNNGGLFGNSDSYYVVLSSDGNYVAFLSYANNLVSNDTNAYVDMYLTSFSFTGVATPTPTIVPTWTPYTPTNTPTSTLTPIPSNTPTITPTPFVCTPTGLVLADIRSDNTPGDQHANSPRISGNGRYIVFQTTARLTATDVDNQMDVYRFDRQTCTVLLVSNSLESSLISWYTNNVSDDGNRVIYNSNSPIQLYLADIAAGTQTVVSQDNNNQPVAGTFNGILSGNGEFVVITTSTSLTNDTTGSNQQIYLRGLVNGTTTRLTNAQFYNTAHEITPDGRYVLFTSSGSYSNNDTDQENDLYRWDSITGEYLLVSPCLTDNCYPIISTFMSMSANGGRVAFEFVTNLDTSETRSVVYDVATNTYFNAPFAAWGGMRLSRDGDVWVAGAELPESPTIYQAVAYRLSTNQLVVLSQNTLGQRGDKSSGDVWLSADGAVATFFSYATNLHSFINGCAMCSHVYSMALSFVGAPVPTPTPVFSPTPSNTPTSTNTPSPTDTFTPNWQPTPQPPQLLSPLNNAVIYDMRVPLVWSGTTSEYVLEISYTPQFYTLIEGYPQIVSGTTILTLPLLDGTYYWRMQLKPGPYWQWSTPKRFTVITSATPTVSPTPSLTPTPDIPVAPLLVSPANNGLISELEQYLIWSAVSDAVRYEIEIATDSNFTSLVFSKNDVTDWYLHFFGTDLPDGTYFWRVRGINSYDQLGAWSQVRSLRSDGTGIPIAPILTSPVNHAVVNTGSVTMRWGAVTGASSYQVQIALSPTFMDEMYVYRVNTTSLTLNGPNERFRQGLWYWRVLALDSVGNGEQVPRPSIYSPTSQFRLDLRTIPAANATIFVPQNVTSATVIFDWNAAAPSLYSIDYTVIINSDTDDDHTTNVVTGYTGCAASITLTQCSVMGLPMGTYTWFLIASGDPVGYPARTFRISPPAPAAPTLLTPVNNLEYGPMSAYQTFTWSSIAATSAGLSANRYELQFNPSSTFNILMTSIELLDVPQYNGDFVNGTWYWRVRAVNSIGVAGAWSAARKLMFDDTPPAAPVITAPALNGVFNTLRPTVRWNAVAGAVRYSVNVDGTTVYDGTALGFTMPDYLSLGTHLLEVNAYDRAGNTSISTRSFEVTLATQPARGTILTLPLGTLNTRPTFRWVATPYGAPYRFELSDTSDFATVRVSQAVNTTLYTLTVAEALPTGEYFWRVYPDSQVFGISNAWKLVVRGTPPAPLASSVVIAPDALISATERPGATVSWATIPQPADVSSVSYEVQFARNTVFTLNLKTQTTSLTTLGVPQTMLDGIIYVRVRAIYNETLSTESRGTWTTTRSYTQDTTAPAAPGVTAPLGQISTSNVRITWGAVAGAVSYEVIVDGGAAVTRTLTYHDVANLAQGVHTIALRSRDAAGNFSSVTSATFKVFNGTQPLNNAVLTTVSTTRRVDFRWLAPIGATRLIVVSASGNFDDTVTCTPIPATATTCSLTLGRGTFTWGVVNAVGEIPVTTNVFYVIATGALLPPTLQDVPLVNKATNTSGVTFNWIPNSQPQGVTVISYEMQLSSLGTFAPSSTQTELAAGTSIVLTLPDNAEGVRYWRMRTMYAGGLTSAWSLTKTVRFDTKAPASTVLTSPTTTVSTRRPVLRWNAVAGASTYDVFITGENAFSVTYIGRIGTSFALLADLPQGEIQVTLQALDAAGNRGELGAAKSFRVFIGTAPLANSILRSAAANTSVSFMWALSTTTTTYKLQIDANGDTNTLEYDLPTQTTGSRVVSLPHGFYRWRVETTPASVNGAWHTFALMPLSGLLPPTNPRVQGLSDYITPTQASSAVLMWDAPAMLPAFAPQGYSLQISTTSAFTTLVAEVPTMTGNSVVLPALSEGTFYWRVRAVYRLGLTSTWTPGRILVIDGTPPSAFTINPPRMNEILPTRTPTLIWSPSVGASSYRVSFNEFAFVTTLTRFTVPAINGLPNGISQFTVEALDRAGNVTARTVIVSYIP